MHLPSPDRTRLTSPRARDAAAHARFARAVKKRDGYKCRICGISLPEIKRYYPPQYRYLIANHILALSMGGTNELKNGLTTCYFHRDVLRTETPRARFVR